MALEGRRIGYFTRLPCKLRLCLYKSDGVKVADWWLFLFLLYIASLLVGVVFVVSGFASPDFEMSAFGVVLFIAGACLAIVCDILRRFGCGWTRIATGTANPGQVSQENSDFAMSIPYLPGYPGFYSAGEGARPDNPPPYVICESGESAAIPISECTCEATLRTENAQMSDAIFVSSCGRQSAAEQRDGTFSRSGNSRELTHENVTPSTARERLETGNHKPAPPPYDLFLVYNEGRISWSSFDSPPPYGDFV